MKEIISILLSLILLISHMSLTIGTHFCGDKSIESKIVLNEKHQTCKILDMTEPCDDSKKSNTNNMYIENVPCCKNEYQTVLVTDVFVRDSALNLFNIDFTAIYISKNLNLDLFPKSTNLFYTKYIPISLEKDIQILFQTFLV